MLIVPCQTLAQLSLIDIFTSAECAAAYAIVATAIFDWLPSQTSQDVMNNAIFW